MHRRTHVRTAVLSLSGLAVLALSACANATLESASVEESIELVAAPALDLEPTVPPAPAPTPETAPGSVAIDTSVTPVVVTENLEAPWGIAVLPDGSMLITEQLGHLRRVAADGSLDATPISGLPEIGVGGQGGLMDVTVHPDFAANKMIYLSYTAGGENGSWTEIARGVLDGNTLSDVQKIFRVAQTKPRLQHNGSRFTWMADGTLLFSIGDGGNPPTSLEGGFIRNQAQNLDSHLGKILRINDDGTIPEDNPFLDRPDAKPELWSVGHRNPQGLVRDPVTDRVWSTEHGSQGGDELNIIVPGMNYGWPIVTHSVEYGAARTPISPDRTRAGMFDPVAVWTPSIAPGGMAVYRGDRYAGWDGHLLATGLRVQDGDNRGAIFRIEVEGTEITGQSRIDLGDVRVRDVEIGADGLVYALVTDKRGFRTAGERNGRLVRLDPAG